MKILFTNLFIIAILFTGDRLSAQCNNNVYGSWGSLTPTCNGSFQNATTNGWAGEYSPITVVAGTNYTFQSSISSDIVTITNTASTVLAFGTGSANWTATFSGTVWFWTHVAGCGGNTTSRTRSVMCGGAPPCSQNNVNLSISSGSWPGEVSWTLVNSNGVIVANGGAPYNQNICLPAGCYDLNMNDSYGDGWNGANYTFTLNGNTISTGTLSTGSSGTAVIGIGTNCNTPPPPANDNCNGAIPMSCGTQVTVNTNNATTDPAGSNVCGTTITTPGVWYRITGNGQQMTVSTVGLTTSDTKLMVFSGSCAGLTCVGGIDDFGGTLQSSVTWNSINGTTYYVLAGLFSGTGTFPMSLTCVTPCPTPSNDLCANAPVLNLGTNNNQTHLGTGCGSTATLGTYKDVWVAFTVPCGGMNIAIDFCGSTPIHSNAYINIFSDCSFATFTSATNWDFTSCSDGNLRLYWNNVPAGTYYYPILIDPTWETNYVLNISGTPLHTPAVAPTSITGTTAVCSGQNTTLTLQGGSAGTDGTPQWFAGSCGSTVIGTGNSITVAPTANTTYFVRYTSSCNTTTCSGVAVNLNSNSTALTSISAPSGTVCPNTNVTLTASGGTAGTGSQINWYSGPNGTGSLLGTGSSVVVAPSSAMTVYARREGTCNTSSDQSASINLKNFIYAPNGTNASAYCTDNAGWHHFYNGDDIILSLRGDLSNVSSMTAQIRNNGSVYTDPGNPLNCLTGWTSGEAQFEMQRNWNVNYSGTLSGNYEVRYYFDPQERQDVIDAANAFMSANPSCGYTYKYNLANSGWFWFKNNNLAYSAPSFDDNPNFNLLSSTTPGNINGINYTEIAGITGFSGGTGGVVLVPGGFLPVEWLYFKGMSHVSYNTLEWGTSSEENTDHFEVERSKDGVNFEYIGKVQANGNSTEVMNYSFDDFRPSRGDNYYRIKLVNKDGTTELTEIVVLNNNSTLNANVYPNPVIDEVFYNYSTDKVENVSIEILDMLGRVIISKNVNTESGINNIKTRTADLVPGAYIMKVTHSSSNDIHTVKIIKK